MVNDMKNSNWLKDEKQFYKVVYLASATLLLGAFLNNFLLDSTLGYSLYAGYCFFIALIFFNKKALKEEKIKRKTE